MANIKPKIVYTQTFEQLLDILITYLADFSSEVAVIERLEETIERFESLVLDNPFAANISPSLQELGVHIFREFHTDNFRIIYRVENNRIIVDVICQQKKSLIDLLFQYCLLKH